MSVILDNIFESLDEEVIAYLVSARHNRDREEYPEEVAVQYFKNFGEELMWHYQDLFAQTIDSGGLWLHNDRER